MVKFEIRNNKLNHLQGMSTVFFVDILEADLTFISNFEFNILKPIENRTAFPGLLSLLWYFRCWLQNH